MFPIIVVVPMRLQYKHVHEKHAQVVNMRVEARADAACSSLGV